MKNTVKQLATELLSSNKIEKLEMSKNDILDFINEKNEDVLFKSFEPIIEEDYNKIFELLKNDEDANIEKERLRIISVLVTISSLF